jgi:ABC-type polysaccharide/polyol phosphate export permease
LPWFLVIVAVQLLFTTGLALILAALTVHFRDIRDLLSNLLTLWFFATPIIYPWTMETFRNPVTKELWPSYWWLFNLNPFFHLAVSYQEVLFYPGPFGHMSLLLLMAAVSVAVFLAGYWLFDRLRDSFAEAV